MIIWEIKLAEIFTIGLSVIGGGFALYQWIKTSKLKRANYYNEAYLKLREDKDIVDILHMIDYGMKKWYPFESHDDPQIENKVDKTLGFLDYLCYLRNRKLIGEREFRNIEYRIIRVGYNSYALEYLYNLYHFSKRNGTRMSFSYLLGYLEEKNMIDKEFWNPESKVFDQHLNF